MAHETNEVLRKVLHIAFGAFAITLKYLPWRVAALIALLAVIGNWLILHRLVGRGVARHERGWDAGIVLYPAAVLVLILVFNWHVELAAIAWVILAAGDGFATIIGKTTGGRLPLPWNRDKSWSGLAAFIVFGFAAGWAIDLLFGGNVADAAILGAVVAAAIVETLPLGFDDNVTVPAVAGATLAILAIKPLITNPVPPSMEWPWLLLNTILAIAGFLLRTVNLSGAVVGWVLGAIVIAGGGPAMYVALLAFFVVGTACTKAGYGRKASEGLAQENRGRRGAGHAIANVGVAALCAVACWRGLGLVPLFMGIAALATAAADTAGSEVGKLIGRRAFSPLRFRPVERGSEGAISLEGTLAGLIAGFLVAVAGTAMAVNRLRPGFLGVVVVDKAHVIAVLTAAAFLGSYAESIIGSFHPRIPNGTMNFANTAIGAFLFWAAWNFVPMFGWEL